MLHFNLYLMLGIAKLRNILLGRREGVTVGGLTLAASYMAQMKYLQDQ